MKGSGSWRALQTYFAIFLNNSIPRAIISSLAAYEMRKCVSRWLKMEPGMMSSMMGGAGSMGWMMGGMAALSLLVVVALVLAVVALVKYLRSK